MTNDLMERRLSAALDKTAPDDVAGVLSRCTERKGTVVPMKKKNQRMKKWMQAMAACLAVLLLGGGVLVQQAHAVTSVVSLDVNPSIELRVNSREKVVSCQALNDEAAAVLADMDGGRDLKGVKADVAVNAIVGSLVRCGYLDTLSSAILISVEDKDQARAQRLQQELTSVAGGALGDSRAAVLSQTVQQDKDLEKLARSIVDTLGGEFYTKAQVGIGSVIAGIKDLARSFREAQAALEGRPIPPLPPLRERWDTAVRQVELSAQYQNERVAMLQARHHLCWYLKGISHANYYKEKIVQLSTLSELHALSASIKRDLR